MCLWPVGGRRVCLMGCGVLRSISRLSLLLSILSSLHFCVCCWGVQGSRCDVQLQGIAACTPATCAVPIFAGSQQAGFTFSCASALTEHFVGRQ
jgi:hypothetical protein